MNANVENIISWGMRGTSYRATPRNDAGYKKTFSECKPQFFIFCVGNWLLYTNNLNIKLL